MKVEQKTSEQIIDRRKHVGAGFLGGLFIAVLAFIGASAKWRDPDPDRDLVYVVSSALDRGQTYWAAHVDDYRTASVVLYEASTSTACGRGLATAGPFYCPADERVYIDLSFLRAVPGDLARAYVIEHELGHHVQKLRAELRGDRVELGADCYAGELMRAERAAGHLETGDVEAALSEAAAVGDDRICPNCSPEQWTHGSSAERVQAVSAGLDGNPCPF